MAKPTKYENIYFPQPPSASQAWISAYFAQAKKKVGVYLRLAISQAGKLLFDALTQKSPSWATDSGPWHRAMEVANCRPSYRLLSKEQRQEIDEEIGSSRARRESKPPHTPNF
ncbi:MAG: hypothetical protein ABI886_03910 [Betaproteobacteria bacterium]